MEKETLATHFGYNSKDGHGTMAVPIYQSTAFDFGSCETAADRFALKELGYIYSRLNNPTLDVFEARMAALEGSKSAISTSSGQAAIFYAIANLAENGDNIIIAKKIYGGTTTLLTHSIKRFGIEARIFDSQNVEDLESLIDNRTKAIFFETISNPQIAISNIEKIVAIADKYSIVSIADNTVATPILLNPFKKGVDVVVHSASKYISGQGLSVAGVVIGSENLNSKLVSNPRYDHFNTPDKSNHDLLYSDLAEKFNIFILRIRLTLLRDIGATLSAFNAFQLIQGIETLSIRVREHSKNALLVAEFLEKHPKVKSVNYPGLSSSKDNAYIKANFTDGLASGLISFDVGSFEYAEKILNSTKIFSIAVNIGDSKSIITHPASTTHHQLSEDDLQSAGVSKGLIRLSIGLENSKDLIKDLEEAML